MSGYDVHWTDDALVRVAECAAKPGVHAAIVGAVTRANEGLKADGTSHAGHLAEGLWHRDFEPLRIYFTINEQARAIEVEMVRALR